MQHRICFTGSHNAPEVKQAMERYMQDRGFALEMVTMKTRDAYEWKEDLADYDIIISNGEKYDAGTIGYLSGKLKMISRCGLGYDEIDIEAAGKLGIPVTNCAGTMSDSVAETALAFMLNLTRRYPEHNRNILSGAWSDGKPGRQLAGKTVGFVGFGSIARKLAQYLRGFGCELIACDSFWDEGRAAALGVRRCTLEEVAADSDFVSLHVPANAETKGMINKGFLSTMKRSAYLINTARGPIVDEADLVDALRLGSIAGAGLDVFENEPIGADNPLLTMGNVFLTPHIASLAIEATIEAGEMACENALRFIEGKPLQTQVNRMYMEI